MPPRTRNARDNGEPLVPEDPARMPVAALQEELQRLGYEHRKGAGGNRPKGVGLAARLRAARTLGA